MEYNNKNYKAVVDIGETDGQTRKVCVEGWNERHAEKSVEILTHVYIEKDGKLIAKPWIQNPYQVQIVLTPGEIKRGWPGDILTVKFPEPYASIDAAEADLDAIIKLAHANNLFD